jgi:hypothetical protein
MEVCTESPTFYNTKFDLTELDRYTITMGYLRVHDVRKSVTIYTRVQGAGELTFVQKAYHPERAQWIFPI